jgi:hypothetical protein
VSKLQNKRMSLSDSEDPRTESEMEIIETQTHIRKMPNLVCLILPMKDPYCVLLSFAHTGVLDGRIKHPGWCHPLIENCENWFEKKGLDFKRMRLSTASTLQKRKLYDTLCCHACVWGRPSFSQIDSH